MNEKKYIYSILKYQHSALLGESLNIGVLIYFPTEDKIVFKYSKNLTRVKAIYELLSEKTIKHYLAQIEHSVHTVATSEWSFFEDEKYHFFDDFIEKNLLPRDGSVLQFGKSKKAFLHTSSAEETVTYLTNRFIFETHKDPGSSTIIKEPQLTKKFYGFLSHLNFEKINAIEDKFYKNYKVVNETGNEFNFDYAWQNGSLNLVKPLSFDLKEAKGIADKAYKNYGLFTDLKSEAEINKLRYDLLVARPSDRNLFREFDHAINLLSNLQKVDIIFEEEIENYSNKAFKALTKDL